jgi:hypothetical protein
MNTLPRPPTALTLRPDRRYGRIAGISGIMAAWIVSRRPVPIDLHRRRIVGRRSPVPPWRGPWVGDSYRRLLSYARRSRMLYFAYAVAAAIQDLVRSDRDA